VEFTSTTAHWPPQRSTFFKVHDKQLHVQVASGIAHLVDVMKISSA
jgi:hypothetical protein